MDNLRRFLVVFIFVIFLTVSISGIVLANQYRKMAHEEEHSLEVSAPTYDPSNPPDGKQQESFNGNILFIIGDSDGTETELLVIMHADTETPSLNFMYVPKDMQFATSADRTVDIMGNLLALKGTPDSCTSIIASYFDMNIDYYVHLSSVSFVDLINTLDADGTGIQYTIPIDMKYSVGKYAIDLKKDTKSLRGAEALSFIQFYRTEDDEYPAEMLSFYDGSDIKRIEASQKLLSAFLSQKVIKTGDKSYEETFVSKMLPFLEKCETNINEDVIRSLAAVFTGMSAENVRYYRFAGREQYLEKYYIIYNNMCRNLISDSDFDSDSIIMSDFKSN